MKITKSGILLSETEDIIDGSTGTNWSGSYTFSDGTFTCNVATASLKHSFIKILPDDIFCIEFDLKCAVYTSGSGVFVGGNDSYWNYSSDSSHYTAKRTVWSSTNQVWQTAYNSNNPYYINNYVSTSWGHVRTYVCGSNITIDRIPSPEITGGASSYSIAAVIALDGSDSSHLRTNELCFFRLGANTVSSDTQFVFKNIKAYKLGNIETTEEGFKIQKDFVNATKFVEY